MADIPLHFVWTYTDRDRAFWDEHLEDWVPRRVFDAHVHVVDNAFRIETPTEELKRSSWVMELEDMQDADTAQRCYQILYPGRHVSCLAFAYPSLGWEIEGSNAYVAAEARARGWLALALVRPTWVAEQVAWLLDRPGVIGLKPYYMLIGYDRATRDRHLGAGIFDFMPHHQLEVLDDRRGWLTLHVPRTGRLADPDNLRDVRELRRRYPSVKLVLAHLGRCYTLGHAEAGLIPLADDPGIYFDVSAVLNPDVLALALRRLGPRRILYGTDNPFLYMRGRQQWHGGTYRNRTDHPFHFNAEREPPEVEARYTLYLYEALKALKDAANSCGLDRAEIEAIFSTTAERLIADVRGPQ